MSYKYDVFISYKRGWRTESWLTEYFLPLFSDYLNDRIIQYCGREASPIFLDKVAISPEIRSDHRLVNFRGIEPGKKWEKELEYAIQHSRCILALWSPSYFKSEWCMKEWSNFQARQTSETVHICEPIIVHDCEDRNTLPSHLAALQAFEFKKTVLVGAAFLASNEYIELQHLCDQLAESIAKKLAKVQNFKDWPIIDGPAIKKPDPIGQIRIGS